MTRFQTVVIAAVAALPAVAPALFAEESVFDNCKVVKVEGNKLFLSKDGNEHSCEVTSDAKITLNDKTAKLADLKSGMKAKVTARKGDGTPVILKVEATDK